ncbi:2-hydroxyacid dehydrogenase [Colwellia piezophila]|uniref:2-hydroxyacid dehydrogenase n=1 Tax=Colwellia piezophila TaxID=211668 RepID=UPI00036BB030|nr:glyoxylate/hydroxypyruvate reductase A [Colwellia piezophila]
MNNIVFISGSESATKSLWLAEIQKQLINETILLPEQIGEAQAKQVDIAIVANPDPKDLARFPNLVWIQSLWAGVEQLIAEVVDKPVKLVKLDDPQLAKTMAESVLAWTLYLQRNMPGYAQQQVNKQWRQLPCITSAELRVSILGAGALGIAALETLKKLDYQVSCWSRTPKQLNGIQSYLGTAGLHTMLKKTDILINLLPLTPETYHLLGKELLSTLPKGAKLINFSRGAVIDTKALLNLLETGHINHAVLDVFEHEPLAPTDAIWSNPNITVLPHISAPTNMCSAAKVIAKNITSYRENNVIPIYVDVKQGY